MHYDLIIRRARLHRHDGFVDIAIANGRFARVVPLSSIDETWRDGKAVQLA